jgi:hypothetical protein
MRADQVYVTHCLPADSVYNRPGFEVRATSTNDPDLHQFALSHPAYELPLDLRKSNLTPADAPTRLALLTTPEGNRVLMHTVYVAEDTCGRKNSFFTHALCYPSLALREALACWGSPDWMLDYRPGASKSLPAFNGVPRPGPLNDETLCTFLGGVSDAPEPLARLMMPDRLDESSRRLLLRHVMKGLRLVLQTKESDPRSRLYLLAEPGLVALLLYGAARLLPEGRHAFLTFSTYENLHRVLREYRLARVIGTYSASTEKSLDHDYFTARGYAIDSFSLRCSPELDTDLPELFDDAINLAVSGEWTQLDEALGLLGSSALSATTLQPALTALPGWKRLSSGQGGVKDLPALLRFQAGRAALRGLSQGLLSAVLHQTRPDGEEIALLAVEDDSLFEAVARNGPECKLPLLQARARHLIRAEHPALAEQVLALFRRYHPAPSSEASLKLAVGNWNKMLEGCPEGLRDELHLLFLERFIPEGQSKRVASALVKKGVLDSTVYDNWLAAKQAPLVEKDNPQASDLKRWPLRAMLTHLLFFVAGFALGWFLATR